MKLREELGVEAVAPAFVCTLLLKAEEFLRLHYYAFDQWRGEVTNGEADGLLWVPLANLDLLGLEVDRVAVREYLRVYNSAMRDATHAERAVDHAAID